MALPEGVTEAGASSAPEWRLFLDWCEATGRPTTTEADRAALSTLDLVAYAQQVPCAPTTLEKRLRAVCVGLGWVPGGRAARERDAAPAWGVGPAGSGERLPLSASLLRCPVSGWPGSFRGRRDAWLLALMAPRQQGGLGMTRDEARTLSVKRVRLERTGDGTASDKDAAWSVSVRVPYGEQEWVRVASNEGETGPLGDPEGCPACAVLRWLHVVSLATRWGRGAVREYLTRARKPQAHDCGRDGSGGLDVDLGWPEVWVLAPAIDQHGWATDWRPMSGRAVTTVLSMRTDRLAPVAATEDEGLPEEWEVRGTRHADLVLDDLFEVLDEAADAADEVNARIRAILDETAGMLGGLSGPA